jgi:hypothetical protein
MKKIILALISCIYLLTNSAFAEIGLNVGISGNAGLFTATGKEVDSSTGQTPASETHNDSEHGEAAWGSIFIEKTIGSRFLVGVDYVPSSLETETTESVRHDMTDSATQTAKENKIQIDFEDLTTFYLALNVTENAYIKAGIAKVDVITNENLATGSSYGNTDLDGTVYAIGYNKDFDNSMFIRVEGSYMNFDGASLTSTTNSDNKVTLKNLDGMSGKISIGKSF